MNLFCYDQFLFSAGLIGEILKGNLFRYPEIETVFALAGYRKEKSTTISTYNIVFLIVYALEIIGEGIQ